MAIRAPDGANKIGPKDIYIYIYLKIDTCIFLNPFIPLSVEKDYVFEKVHCHDETNYGG